MRYLLGLAFLFQVGCATPSRQDCETSNWKALGLKDGQAGLPLENFERRENACKSHNVSVDKESYLKAYQEGLKSYCTVSHFYFSGEMGYIAPSTACPAEQRTDLDRQFAEGRKLWALKNRQKHLHEEIERFKQDKSFVADVQRASAVINAKSPTAPQEKELFEVEHEISRMERSAPDNAEYCEHEMQHKKMAENFIPAFTYKLSPETERQMKSCSRTSPTSIR